MRVLSTGGGGAGRDAGLGADLASRGARAHRIRLCRRGLCRSAVVIVAAVGLVASAAGPAWADPPAPGPGAGALPVPEGNLVFPPAPQPVSPPPPDALGPLAQEIIETSRRAELLGEHLKSIDAQLEIANAITAEVRAEWQASADALAQVRARAERIAAEAYQRAQALGPLVEYSEELQDLGRIAPGLPGQVPEAQPLLEFDSITADIRVAEEVEQAARSRLNEAEAAQREIADLRAVVHEQFVRQQAALAVLLKRNQSLADLEAAREAYEAGLAASRGFTTPVLGWQAAPEAIKAVIFVLSQKGKPYRWAAAGPDAYDCSGLVLAAYRTVGVRLTHRAAIQYWEGTRVQQPSQLLPGDLVFFSSDRWDASQIYHVGMYIGNGRMVHAPNVGEVVKEAPVYWSTYFGATRIFPAIPVPAITPTPTASPTRSPTPTPTPTPSPTPSPGATADPSPTTTPSATADPSPTVTDPTPTPSPTPAAAPTASPSATADPSPTALPSQPTTTDPAPTSTAEPVATPTPAAAYWSDERFAYLYALARYPTPLAAAGDAASHEAEWLDWLWATVNRVWAVAYASRRVVVSRSHRRRRVRGLAATTPDHAAHSAPNVAR